MSVAAKSAIGIGVGALMAGGAWYVMRTQDRATLVDLLTKDTKIPVMQALSAAIKPPKSLELIAAGDFEAYAAEKILYTETTTPQSVYANVAKEVQKYVADIPQDALDTLFDKLGIKESTVKQIKELVDFLRGAGGGSSGSTQKQRPGA